MVSMRGLTLKSLSRSEVPVLVSFIVSSSGSLMCTFRDRASYLSLDITCDGKGMVKMLFSRQKAAVFFSLTVLK